MKRFGSLLLAALLICALWLPAAAEDLFDQSYMRFNDYAGVVTQEEEAQLNAKAKSRRDELETDFPICVYRTRQSTTELSEFAADYYARNLFGCGENKSGVLLVWDLHEMVYDIYYFGDADTIVGDTARDKLSDSFKADCRNEDLSYYDVFDRYYDNVFATVKHAREHPHAEGMPDWYPADTAGFEDFHGENLPPVVDDAHIFTDEQFETLSEKISAMNARLGIGYAAFTSDDNHGLMPEEYSSDFLHFNGYGVGEDYGAVVFYLSLDPEDRCWLTTSINSYEPLFGADVTYEIDEMVDSSIRGGAYYEAFVMHADYVESLFSVMSEDLPSWYPDGTRTYALARTARQYADKRNETLPRVTDNAGMLSDAQKSACEDTLRALSAQYGLELVIFTDSVCRAPKSEEYADDFYYYNGYGGDGIALYLFDTGKYSFGTLHYGCAKTYDKLDIAEELRDKVRAGTPDEAIEQYVKLLTFMLRHDRLPMHTATAVFCLVVGVVAGLIVASVVVDKMKSAMRIMQQTSVRSYLVDGSLRIDNADHHFLYRDVSRRARPKPSDSSSGSSSGSSRGGSTHTSGHSAGGSYSSGGRRF